MFKLWYIQGDLIGFPICINVDSKAFWLLAQQESWNPFKKYLAEKSDTTTFAVQF